MSIFRKVFGTSEKEEKLEVKNPVEIEMGWGTIASKLNDLRKSKEITVQVKNLAKSWKPLISDLEQLVKQIQTKHTELMESEIADQSGSPDPIKHFIAITDKIITKAKVLMESVSYDLFFVSNEKEAQEVKADNAVIVYKEKGNYRARVVAKKSPSIKQGVDVIVDKVPTKLIDKCEKLSRNHQNEVLITKESIGLIEELTKELSKAAAINSPEKTKRRLLTGALQLANEIPHFLDAFSKLPIVPIVTDRLNKFKTEAEEFDFSGMVKAVLPIDTYVKIKKEVFSMLEESNFGKLSRDQQAAALALMEVYNEGIKFAILAMDKIEIEMHLAPGSLATKLPIIDDKPMEQICQEFNAKYQAAMRVAGYTTLPEVYPFKASLLEQRNTMLAALPPEPQGSKISPKRARIEKRIAELGEVKAMPQRESFDDFSSFIKNKFSENYRRFKKLKARFEKESKKEHAHDNQANEIAQTAKEFILKAENELKAALDETIYKRYFSQSSLDKFDEREQNNWVKQNGKWIEKDEQGWVYDAGQAFIQLKNIIAQMEKLQQQHNKLLATQTPFEHLEYRAKELDELVVAGTELVTALHRIKENPHLNKLISIRMLEEIVPRRFSSKEALAAEAKEVKAAVTAITSSNHPLEDLMEKLKKVIRTQSKQHVQDEKLREDTDLALEKVTELVLNLKHLKELEKETGEKPSLLTFAMKHFSQIMGVISSLPQILATLNKLSKVEAELMAVEINKILKGMVLLSDKLEIQFCLKEGFITDKLRPMISAYHAEVRSLGYDFKPEDRYPYTIAIADQRKKLLKEDSLLLQQKLIRERIGRSATLEEKERHEIKLEQAPPAMVNDKDSIEKNRASADNALIPGEKGKQDKEKKEKEKQDREKQRKIKQEMDDVVSKHIQNLRFAEIAAKLTNDSDAKKEVGDKIELLNKFKGLVKKIPLTQAVEVETILQELRRGDPQHIHLLYEGSTGKVLKQLEGKNVSPEDLFKAVDIELSQLKKQRGTTHYIYSMHKAKLLEERINACEKLQNLMKDNSLRGALAGLSFNEKSLLEKYDHVFLDNLKLLEQAISVEHRTKTIIGAVATKNEVVAKNDPVQVAPIAAVEHSAEQKYAIQLIDERLAELESTKLGSAISSLRSKLKSATSLALADIRLQKIDVLTELKAQLLQPGVSLTVAINRIKAGEKTKETAHLIFEGRTGKTLKAAQNMTITRAELINRLDAEINELKRQRYTPLRVFSPSHKVTGDEQIEALQKLRAEIMKDPNKSMREVINRLNPEDKNVLQRYDADLLKDFDVFEKAVKKQSNAGRY